MPRAVKSAVRVLEVLEFFDRLQRPATVVEIARGLGYPVSSTSILLGNLLELGYLQRAPDLRRYLPTARVTLLGAWIEPLFTPSGEVLRMMAEVGEQTGETVILAVPIRDQVQYLHVVPGTSTMRMQVGPGTMRSLLGSGLGRLLLSAMPEEKVRHIVLRHNTGPDAVNQRVSYAALQRDFASIRTRGYYYTLRGATPGAAMLGVLLPMEFSGLPLAMGLGGWAREVRNRHHEYAAVLLRAVQRHLRA